MPILTHISSNNRIPIVVVPEHPPQTKRRVQVPSLIARAKRAIQINLAPVPVVYRPPNPRLLEVLENPPEKHVIPLLFRVHATGPITDVQTVPSEPARQQLVPLLPAQVPNP